MDTDTDSDADTDTGTDLVSGNLAGTIELTADLAIYAASCDGTFTLTGTPFAGYCPGCTFNFEVISKKTRDDGVDCPDPEDAGPILSIATYRIWLAAYQVLFQYSPYWSGMGWYGGAVASDPALAWGVDYYPDPLMYPIAYAGSPYGAITKTTDTTIDWTIDWAYYDTYYGTGLNELHAVGHAYIVP